jgi:hypothetical protein
MLTDFLVERRVNLHDALGSRLQAVFVVQTVVIVIFVCSWLHIVLFIAENCSDAVVIQLLFALSVSRQ